MRALLFTTGSPFARAVRIVLDELGLDYERREEITTPSAEERAAATGGWSNRACPPEEQDCEPVCSFRRQNGRRPAYVPAMRAAKHALQR